MVANGSFKPIDAFANYVKSSLSERNLYNNRIKTRRLASLILIEIADKEGVGKIKNPSRVKLSAA